ncbi:ATP-binding protein [Streptomyces sp. SL13]|uniref:ATP-binding protein n=1 Tax=Streptantibioticus silvisoli TaxID=2705255 RepID=A0AA90JXR2_9ACTN|nr:ATP-binding protein [Streptantibioticus silvisoli]MDI5970451.1 ATP-binding protein [Streptantibioticus silvisoli]
MSHPLKRRMAQAALLIAAAAPVIGLGAGTASAAGLPQAADLGGLSSTDAASALGDNVDGATHQAVGVANVTGRDAQQTLLPAAQKTVVSAGRTMAPAAQKTVGDAAGQVGQATGHTAQTAKGGSGLTDKLPLHGLSTGGLTTQGQQNGPMIPAGGLPL